MPTLVNATPVAVEFLDGRTETVPLRHLSIRQLYLLTEHLVSHQMPAIVALCAAQPIEWTDTLSDASFGLLAQKCMELNFPRAMTLSKSDPVMAANVAPLMLSVRELLQRAADGESSNASSPGPAPLESAAASGNASSI